MATLRLLLQRRATTAVTVRMLLRPILAVVAVVLVRRDKRVKAALVEKAATESVRQLQA